jgi:hypothetical protein
MSLSFLEERLAILTRTPDVLDAQLRDLPMVWTAATEGEGTWSPYDVVGHLIHGEKGDWMARTKTILNYGPSRPFEKFDREAQFRDSAGAPLNALLNQFRDLRKANLERLIELDLEPAQLDLMGAHPVLGAVTLRQLLSTWTAHDLAHLLQINRVMARRFREEVGPWAQFLSVMR